jgi:nucleoside-diphosphate-sugar epimerase
MLLVTGAGGFIGRAIAGALGDQARAVAHRSDAWPDRLAGVTAIVHAGRDPRLGTPDHRIADDAELAIARLAAERGLPFLTLGTRKVYAPADMPLGEDAPLGPCDRYGEQKLQMEEALQRLLGEQLTRLRLANIFGFERGRHSFMGLMLDGLERNDTIRFDMSPFVARDFLPVELAAAAIATLLQVPPGGIVNIGSGVPLETGRLALAVIEGRGAGRLLVESPDAGDTFTLDVGRMRALTGITIDSAGLLRRANEIGQQLRAAEAAADACEA